MTKPEDKNKKFKEQPYTPLGRGGVRCKIGEKSPRGEQRQNFSHRAAKGNLDVIKRACPHCKHHKIFATLNGKVKCCKCDKEIELK